LVIFVLMNLLVCPVENRLCLGDIPLVGWAFTKRSTQVLKLELIVLITLTEVDRAGRELGSSR